MYIQRAISAHVVALILFVLRASLPACGQIGVATGNGVATPARTLLPGTKPPVNNYQDIGAEAGLTNVNVSGAEKNKQYIVETTGNGVAIFDYNNDGLPDMLLVNGDRFHKDGAPTGTVLYHNLGGLKFEDVTKQAGLTGCGPARLKNPAPALGDSILIRALRATNRDAIGARVTVSAGRQKQMDEVRSGGSYISQNDFRLYLGLGTASSADVSVRWPDGKVESFTGPGAGQIVTIQQGKGVMHKQPYVARRLSLLSE